MAIATRAPVGDRICRRCVDVSVGGGGLERLYCSRLSGYVVLTFEIVDLGGGGFRRTELRDTTS